jgi:hypothetical protein
MKIEKIDSYLFLKNPFEEYAVRLKRAARSLPETTAPSPRGSFSRSSISELYHSAADCAPGYQTLHPKVYVSPSCHSGEACPVLDTGAGIQEYRRHWTPASLLRSSSYEGASRRGDVKGFTGTMKNASTRPPPYMSFWDTHHTGKTAGFGLCYNRFQWNL